jgi:phosphoribosylamine--glycine ligase
MGAYAPAPDISPQQIAALVELTLRPVVEGMAARGIPYRGVLYAGLMLTGDGPKVLEYNGRFGDPETQVILPLLASDLAEICLACATGRLDEIDVRWRAGACAGVVLASAGYPGPYTPGQPITGLEEAAALPGVTLFHAGTARQDGRLVTAGGRVLVTSATGDDLDQALARAYHAAERVDFAGKHYRRDIGRLSHE